ncbi:MAG: DNA polymerase I, partial [Lachnospiraceae bacterium]|nr:DNA polymerase I [Lachnospiraceae bacterium]
TFQQTVTATGRLSCINPNLQNIPIRTEDGRLIRKAFSPKEGYVFVDADYSQVELRVLAHMSGDEGLIDAFNRGDDIHTSTASKIFDVEPDDVTSIQRRAAKAVNFGIVYGESAYGLSENLNIPVSEAKGYIEDYFRVYPKMKEFLEGLVEEAKETGYACTMLGRRRPVVELESKNFNIRGFGERVAKNMPIQGTAADIIKLAMINVDKRLKADSMKSKLILQVHDELLIEAAKDEEEKIYDILKEEMMNVLELSVPLEIDIHSGTTWYEAK